MNAKQWHFSPFTGEFDVEWMADDLSFCWRPGCDTGGSHERRACDHGARGQGLPQARTGQLNGRLEVLDFFRLPRLPLIKSAVWEREEVGDGKERGWRALWGSVLGKWKVHVCYSSLFNGRRRKWEYYLYYLEILLHIIINTNNIIIKFYWEKDSEISF